jgi:5'-nucleotidase
MKLLYIDLDGRVTDFVSAMNTHAERTNPIYKEHPDKKPNIFRGLSPITGAIKAVNLLLEFAFYEVFTLSIAPWNNPSAWTDKRLWLEDKFGDSINRRLILTHRKDLVKGDILINDRPNKGAKDFEGEWIHFGSEDFSDWSSVLKHLL